MPEERDGGTHEREERANEGVTYVCLLPAALIRIISTTIVVGAKDHGIIAWKREA